MEDLKRILEEIVFTMNEEVGEYRDSPIMPYLNELAARIGCRICGVGESSNFPDYFMLREVQHGD